MAEPAPANGLPGIERLERRAGLLLVLLVLLVAGSVAYVLYARGVFEPTQRLVLVADDSEGVAVGMDVGFSGFPIGRVARIELAEDGTVRILVDVPRKDAHWLRTSSVFTLSRGLVGNVAIKAYSGVLADPPLPDGATRRLLVGDATAEIPRLVSQLRELAANLNALTAPDSALAGTLAHVKSATGKLDGGLGSPRGAMDLVLGQDAPKVGALLAQANRMLAGVDATVRRADEQLLGDKGLLRRADERLLGEQGLVPEGQAALRQLGGLLAETRGTLKKVDGLLAEAEGVARNARVASADLGTLRSEVEASLRKVEHLVNEINRRWPLARDTELKLP